MYSKPACRSEGSDEVVDNLDLNNDGKVDAEDGKIATKVLNVIKPSKSKGGK